MTAFQLLSDVLKGGIRRCGSYDKNYIIYSFIHLFIYLFIHQQMYAYIKIKKQRLKYMQLVDSIYQAAIFNVTNNIIKGQ